VVVVARDVSADIQAEQAKANFIAAISHELRTPLTPLKGYLSLFASGQLALGPEAREPVHTMLRHADRLERLISDLLDASQMEGGQSMIRREELDLVELVGHVVTEAERELGARIVFERPGGSLFVVADGLRVKQVLINLVSNAIKYSPPDCPIRIEASAEDGMSVIGGGAGADLRSLLPRGQWIHPSHGRGGARSVHREAARGIHVGAPVGQVGARWGIDLPLQPSTRPRPRYSIDLGRPHRLTSETFSRSPQPRTVSSSTWIVA